MPPLRPGSRDGLRRPRRRASRPSEVRGFARQPRGLLGVGADDPDDHRDARGPVRRAPRSGPRATSSPRVMPPKMLTRIAFTFGSARMRRIAAVTLSARAPPPMSRKFAGSPPARFTRSIVVIASPAPLTMQPIVPSSLMKLRPASRASMSVGSSSSRSRSILEVRVAGQRRVVERDLGVEADELLHDVAVWRRAHGRWPAG